MQNGTPPHIYGWAGVVDPFRSHTIDWGQVGSALLPVPPPPLVVVVAVVVVVQLLLQQCIQRPREAVHGEATVFCRAEAAQQPLLDLLGKRGEGV